MHLNAHEKPPSYLRTIFKALRSQNYGELADDRNVFDSKSLVIGNAVQPVVWSTEEKLQTAFSRFTGNSFVHNEDRQGIKRAFEFEQLPGLLIVPGLIPLDVQRVLLDRMLHRDASNPIHQTNVNLHYHVPYPPQSESFFRHDGLNDSIISPKDPAAHKRMTVSQFLNRKLRWITLGGQYDWTNKVYPAHDPPPFPSDLARLLQSLFSETKPEAAIVNLYSPGDTLSMHRDVSEECDQGLISISIGCDGLFVIGMDPADPESQGAHAVIRLHSGDALYMAGPSRFAWHGVPCIFAGTCPRELGDWPCCEATEDSQFESWRGWMSNKRINLNVRQMKQSTTDEV